MLPLYTLHDIPIRFQIDDEEAARRINEQWQPFLADGPLGEPITITLRITETAPGPPDLPAVSAGPDVSYFREGAQLAVLFPGWGRFDVQLDCDRVSGIMARAAIAAYGIFEDMILIALAPLLRRRGYYAIHAFAAVQDDRALLILGDTGAGKTTTGISLLARGAKLLANDTPLLRPDIDDGPQLYAYPGLLSLYPDSLARFPELAHLMNAGQRLDGSEKISFAADALWPDVWAWRAAPAALVFPTITPELERSYLEPLLPFDALQRLIIQSIEDWDAATIPGHLRALRRLVNAAPAWRLHLAPDIPRLPDLLLPLL
jgi:hypothetical protein